MAAGVVLTASVCSSTDAPSALNTVDAEHFRSVVAAAAQDLMVLAALVRLQTPQGTFVAGVGTTELGAMAPPAADTHFRIASNTCVAGPGERGLADWAHD